MSAREWRTDELDVLRLYYADTPNDELAEMLGRSVAAVSRKAWDMNLSKTRAFKSERMRVVARAANRKLMDGKFRDVGRAKRAWREIVGRHDAGESYASIATDYGVCKNTIRRIVTCRR